MGDIEKIFNFVTYLEGFKKIERFVGQFFWKDYPQQKRYDSDADHTWRMAMMLLSLEDEFTQPFDFKKAMKMVLLHDIPEIIAGDASPLGTDGTGNDSHAYSKEASEAKFKSENSAAQEIFAKLPGKKAKEFYDLWLEFEKQECYEAKIVKAIDKLEGKLQAYEYRKGEMFKEHFDFTVAYGIETYQVDPALEEFGDILLKKFAKDYREFKG